MDQSCVDDNYEMSNQPLPQFNIPVDSISGGKQQRIILSNTNNFKSSSANGKNPHHTSNN